MLLVEKETWPLQESWSLVTKKKNGLEKTQESAQPCVGQRIVVDGILPTVTCCRAGGASLCARRKTRQRELTIPDVLNQTRCDKLGMHQTIHGVCRHIKPIALLLHPVRIHLLY